MTLIIWYIALVAVGDGIAYVAGRAVEASGWGSNTSMIVFLGMYFLTLWMAWVIAVKITAPSEKPA
jgi:hypothetical protein